MNILYYCDEYPPYKNGGIGRVVKLIAEEMAQKGHTVFVAGDYTTSSNKTSPSEYSFEKGVHIYRLSKANQKKDFLLKILKFINIILIKELSFVQFLIAKRKVRIKENYIERIIQIHKIDILEIPDYQDEVLHGLNRSIKFKHYTVPTIIRVHGSCSFIEYYRSGKIKNSILQNDKNHFLRADCICAVSNFSADFVKNYLTGKQPDVIYNPIESLFFNKNIENSPTNTILFFGKIIETKGVFGLIKAFNLIADKYPNIQLKFIGTGDIDKIKSLTDMRYSNRVFFEDFMPKEQIIKEIDASLFCVLPSYFENFSMAALEVLGRSKALIYTERASGKELITNGVNGLLVNPEDINQIAKIMSFLIENPNKREELGNAGYLMCKERFSTDVIIPKIEDYYLKLINNKL
ncbi:MAG: glycosyltransferase family 4 protein [Porphyromonadaceae bacterium]|nr:glycosyltransferase family 4 protein [Porphyromonadaceae bacterium]